MSTGRFCSERRGAEVLVDRVEAGEELAEPVVADRDHERQPDRRVDRVAPAHPVPEAEHVRGVDAELRTFSALVDTATKCLATALVAASEAPRAAMPAARGVGQRLQRGEGLGRDDEQRLGRVEVARGLVDVGRVDVGDEPQVSDRSL